jgi:hypothetical protein
MVTAMRAVSRAVLQAIANRFTTDEMVEENEYCPGSTNQVHPEGFERFAKTARQ